ncbi:MAG: hypothetical protein ACFFDF_17090 [Candidatus Odinarchaeota archaeon]
MLKLPKDLQEKTKGKKVIPLITKKHFCPVCNVEIHWNPTNAPNVLKGICPKCNMDFTNVNGNIVGGMESSLSS